MKVQSPRADCLLCSELQGPKMLNNQSGDEGKGKTNYTTKQDVVEDKQVIPQDRTDAFLSVSECSQLPNKFGSKDR